MEEQIRQLEERTKLLETMIFALIKSDKFSFYKHIELRDGLNIAISSGTGTKIGTGTGQKMGFYGVTPIIQRSGSDQAAVATTSATQTNPFGYTTLAQANAIVALVNELRAWAVAQGFIKGSS